MPCEEAVPMRWLFHSASEYGVDPPTQYTVAFPLNEGELIPWVIENSIPSHGEGEQSTKLGGPCPYWLQPPELCKFESWFPLFPPLLGAGFDGGGGDGGGFDGGGFAGGGDGGAGGAGGCATLICSDCCFESPLESETVTPKLKSPAPLGVPATLPEVPLRFTPCGSCPEVTAKL